MTLDEAGCRWGRRRGGGLPRRDALDRATGQRSALPMARRSRVSPCVLRSVGPPRGRQATGRMRRWSFY